MAVATVAMAFTACSKDEASGNPGSGQKVVMTITSDGEITNAPDKTRTEYDEGTNQMNWSAEDETLQVFQIVGTAYETATTTGYSLAGRAATFTVAFNQSEATDFIYSAIYPAASFINSSNSDPAKFKVLLPTTQIPEPANFDPDADLLIAQPIAMQSQPTSLSFSFHRIASLAKMTLKGITAGEIIKTVEFSATQSIAGRCYVDLTKGSILEYAYAGQGDTKTITLNMDDREATGEDIVWFTALPCTLGEGDNITIKVTTDKAVYDRVVEFSATKTFTFASSGVTKFGITNMTRTENVTDEYILLTDLSELTGDDMIIITNGTDGEVAALSTTQETNYRGYTNISIADNKITTLTGDIQILVVGNGTKAATYSFYDEALNGYLAAVSSSSNNMQTKTTLDDNGSWDIAINPETYAATVKAQGSYTRNWLRYNPGSPRFSCYGSGQDDIYIFYKASSKTAIPTPAGLSADAEGNVVTVIWDAVDGAADYTVKCGTQTQVVDATVAEFTVAYDTTYEISVVANPADTENYKSSAPATTSVTTGPSTSPAATFDLTTTAIANPVDGQNLFTGADAYAYDAGNNIGLVYGIGSGSSAPYFYKGSSNNTQLNVGNTLTIEGKTMSSIEITTADTSAGTLSSDVGSFADWTWSGSANKVTFTAAGGYVRMTEIIVYYDDASTAVFTPAIVAVDPTSLNFEAEGGNESINVTVMNQGSNTLAASGLSGTLSAVVSNNAVNITATANDSGSVSQELVISLTNGNSVTIPVRQAAGGATGEITAGIAYTLQPSNSLKWATNWSALTSNNMSWTPAKITAAGSANPGNWDGNSRGQQFGSSSNGITSMSMTGTGYDIYCNSTTECGITSIDVSACAKSGAQITIGVTVGGIEMVSSNATNTVSGSNAAAVVTSNFTSETVLSGDIVITYTLNASGALYINKIAINN